MAGFPDPDSDFTLDEEQIRLPAGARARTKRRRLRWRGREILGFTQGRFRPYLFPLFSPRGFALTAESPADHPHHNSVWIGCDHVHCLVPAADGTREEYTYNLYVDETFQGRAPGSMVETDFAGEALAPDRVRVEQAVAWRGPREWGAPEGRTIVQERRSTTVSVHETFHVVDVHSEITPARWDVTLGPTRHAYFNVRVADSMTVPAGGTLLDADGRGDAGSITGTDTAWLDFSGPVGGGNAAGLCVMPYPGSGAAWWFVADWGVVTVGPFRHRPKRLRAGERAAFACRLIVHDGDAASVDLDALYRRITEEIGK